MIITNRLIIFLLRNFFVFLNSIRVLQSNPISGRSMHVLLFPDNLTYILYIHERG